MEENVAFCKILLIEDFNKICRCCLSVNPLGSIFEIMYEGTPLDKIFHGLFGAELDPKDDLPKKICETCVGKLICCHIFKKRYELAEAALQNVVQIKIENVDCETKSEQSGDNVELGETQQHEMVVPASKESATNDKIKDEAKENHEPKVNIPKKPVIKYPCSCGEIFTSRLEFRQHRELTGHQIPRTHPCKICGKFFTKYTLWAHMRIHDGVKRYSCNYCTRRFAVSGNLKRHLMQHTGEKPHLCEFCGKAFIQHDSLAVHRRVHTGEKPYLCSICGKSFRDKLTLNVHFRSHSGQKSSKTNNTRKSTKSDHTVTFVCDECGRSFSSLIAYKLHLNKHWLNSTKIGENDKRCYICKKWFDPDSLDLHMLTHKDHQFLCNVCGKPFYRKIALMSHSLIHTGEKSLACEFCGKRFARPQALRIHRFGHTGEKPFACPSCPKKFRQSTHLTSHLTVHTGERPYVCPFCEKTFPHKYTLDVHVRKHTGEKPYQCDICKDAFYDSGSLKKHKRSKHQCI